MTSPVHHDVVVIAIASIGGVLVLVLGTIFCSWCFKVNLFSLYIFVLLFRIAKHKSYKNPTLRGGIYGNLTSLVHHYVVVIAIAFSSWFLGTIFCSWCFKVTFA